ncbi:MAG: hypothetical protein E6Q96_10410 [Cyclobacteriaceae bacterium]|nr:MAG: hypothetical protein E6Q96_10410 [Cyclobacteriaceae bacterium]
MNTEKLLSYMLVLHIAGGTVALLTGLGAMLTTKGSKPHRLFGKIYFWGMTAVFVGALFTAIGHGRDFLLMVAFFSYYMTVRGYRILSQKKLHRGQKATPVDWAFALVSGLFIVALIGWGTWALVKGDTMGVVGIVFGLIGSNFLFQDVKSFIRQPTEKMHWWYGHISSMGGSYISAVTAFVVVNIQLPQFQWVLWLLPGVIGGILVGRTIKIYKVKFGEA